MIYASKMAAVIEMLHHDVQALLFLFWPSVAIASTNYCLVWSMHKYNDFYCHLGWRVNTSSVAMEAKVFFQSFLLLPPANIFLLVFELCNLYCFWICSVILYLKYPYLLLVDLINSCKALCGYTKLNGVLPLGPDLGEQYFHDSII